MPMSDFSIADKLETKIRESGTPPTLTRSHTAPIHAFATNSFVHIIGWMLLARIQLSAERESEKMWLHLKILRRIPMESVFK